ncbi:acetyl/propionyl/methylcrotonyl-CoA carboxylase subunit alpha [Caldimonas manganoxidans]|uniref:acetyl/propionyl/methylcrotonyl-CoA carboxylase subunit alpha n=2 Tax=Caldimonas TaxID=196013 RepID=UPI0003778AA3|nr:acetyl/propionyl/methylcrotonyl-CoA carboxylase subunit alpha [Caldimonas manganoxidans]
MFKKILIANRGEIACRVAATARRLGIRTVAVYSDADATAKHVQVCDEAVHIGAAAPRDSYLRQERILEAARATGAQAIHPGYGFLSENESFAEACAQAGIVFIGPPPAAIAAMGSKAAAKALMEKAGVPLVPGYHGDRQDCDFLLAQAQAMGFPVLIKASAGGGGKGMRAVQVAEEFEAALAACKREARSSFGDDHVLIERYVSRPRHIEIQVFCDTHGNGVYLFERDCSVQRRHQKVLEEAPAPGMTPHRRREMGEAAVAAARAVGYVGAGTVEFIAEQDGRFYFMEMNTRLQVEHPVTEAITGHDLVEWQLRVAAGEPLPVRQEDLRIQGHAIEARICAENPEAHFLPATGPLRVFRLPPQASEFTVAPVRVDAGVREGDEISPYYDSMIAKLIVHAPTREQALAQLDAALAQTHIVGLHTNVNFLRRVVTSASFAGADLDTALIERERAHLFGLPGLPLDCAVAGVAARVLADEAALQDADPWSRRDGWRLHGMARRRMEIDVGGQRHVAFLEYLHDGRHRLDLGGQRQLLQVHAHSAEVHDVMLGASRWRLTVYRQGEQFHVFAPEGVAVLQWIDPIAHAGDSGHEAGRLTAPMPGKLLAVHVSVGQSVKKGQALAVMEAMKMEHTIAAPTDGVIEALLYGVGDQVPEGAELLRLKA